jgi:hypothetical protein
VVPALYVSVAGATRRILGKSYSLAVQSQYLTPTAVAVFADGHRTAIHGGRGNVPLYKNLRLRAIEVTARGPVVGPLVFIGSFICPGRRVLVSRWTAIVHSRSTVQLSAPCPRPRLWGVTYGWVGESIGQILVGVGSLRPTAG